MRLDNIGYNFQHTSDFYISRPNGYSDYLLILLKTPAIFTIDGTDITASENSFILYKKGTPQFFRAAGERYSDDWFQFSFTEDENDLIEAAGMPFIPFDKVVYIGDISIFSDIIEKMCHEQYSDDTCCSYITGLYLQLFFAKLGERLRKIQSIDNRIYPYYDRMSRIRSKIYSTPGYDWNVEELSAEAAMSVSYFSHMYKSLFGVSIMNEVINSRVEYAKFMLTTTDIPVARIAETCGYKSYVHFTKQFKCRVGVTPSQYRKENGNQ